MLWSLAAAAVLAFVLYAVRWSARPTHGFAAYYTYSRILLSEQPFEGTYAPVSFDSALATAGLGEIRDVPINLPTNAFMLLPLAWLPPPAAKAVWTASLVVFYAFAVFMLLKVNAIPPSSDLGILLICYAFIYRPAYENIAWGQMYPLLLFLFAWMLKLLRKNQPFAAAVPLAASILLKGYGMVVLAWQLLGGRWRAALLCLCMALAVVLATLPLFGIASWQSWFIALQGAQAGNPAYQTVPGLIAHLGYPGSALWVGIGFGLLGAVLFRLPGAVLLGAGAALGVNVVTAPLAESYHYLLFLPLLFTLAATASNRLLLIVPALLLAMPDLAGWLGRAPEGLLGYHRLAGGIALLGMVLYVTRRNAQELR